LREPQFWFERLQHLDLHRMKLADLKNIPEGYAALTAEQVRDTFRKCYTAERTFRVVAVPANDQIEEEGPSADVKTRSPAKP